MTFMSAYDSVKLGYRFKDAGSLKDLTALCPHCGAFTVFDPINTVNHHVYAPGGDPVHVQIIETACCRGCQGLAVGVAWAEHSRRFGRLLWPLERWRDAAPSDLEPEIRQAYDEARAILPLSPMGAAVLARRCLQHVIRTKLDIQKRTLFDEIEEAVKLDNLSKSTRDALHHVRDIGNWGAHPSTDEAETIIDVRPGEAEYTLEALEMVFADLYVAPARAAAMSKRIEDRKSGGSAADSEAPAGDTD